MDQHNQSMHSSTRNQQLQNHFHDEDTFMPVTGQWAQSNPFVPQQQQLQSDYSSYHYSTPQPPHLSTFAGLPGYAPFTPRNPPVLLTTPLPSQLLGQQGYQQPPRLPALEQPLLSSYGSKTSPASSIPTPNSARTHTPTPRRTLTNADRRRMCIYKRDHPTKSQQDIGGKSNQLVGVSRG